MMEQETIQCLAEKMIDKYAPFVFFNSSTYNSSDRSLEIRTNARQCAINECNGIINETESVITTYYKNRDCEHLFFIADKYKQIKKFLISTN